MKVGDVYEWVTDKAKGHNTRKKMHIFICCGNWRTDGYVFLFISKSNYGGDLKVYKDQGYEFLALEHSFVTMQDIVTYTVDELKVSGALKIGTIAKEQIREIHDAVLTSDTMTGWQIKLICSALGEAF